MIICRDLTVRYGDTVAVNALAMAIDEHMTCSIVGESGCGKTSLLHAVAGLLTPTMGEVVVQGVPVHGIRKGSAIILQNDGLFPWKNVYDNVAVALVRQKMEKTLRNEKIESILEELRILELKDNYLGELSGGQRQRVAIARALVQNPDLLLMDEPTGALDMITKERFQDTLHQLHQDHPMTTLLVTHDIEEAVYLGQKIIVMRDGSIVAMLENPYYGISGIREDLKFYELCLQVRQVMKT